MTDARFADGDEAPVSILARDGDDLAVISALVQDAILPATEMSFRKTKHQFAMLLNRFRWEDRESAARAGRRFERVRSILLIDEVMAVRTQGFDRRDGDTILSLLSVTWEPGEDGTGRVILTLAGDGAVALEVEALEVTLRDVTRPYLAPSGKAPAHGD